MPSQSSTLLRDVQLTSSKKKEESRSDTSIILSCSSPSLQVVEPDSEPRDQHEHRKRESKATETTHVSFIILIWHFIIRFTIGMFVLLNDREQHGHTKSIILLTGIIYGICHMLLLHVLKMIKRKQLACLLTTFASLESIGLLYFVDTLFITLCVSCGVWTMLFLLHVNLRCPTCKRQQNSKNQLVHVEEDNVAQDYEYAYRKQDTTKRRKWFSAKAKLYAKIVWYVFLSMASETGNVFYFWYIMQLFEQEQDAEKQRAILFCINVKLLLTTYSRNMLLDRRFSICVFLGELTLFCATSAIVYCYLFLQLDKDSLTILHYGFWGALCCQILTNLIAFLQLSIQTINLPH